MATKRVIAKQRKVQAEVDRKDRKSSSKPKEKKPPQTGARRYPTNPMPAQHHRKPGIESEIKPRPMFDNPAYRGSGNMGMYRSPGMTDTGRSRRGAFDGSMNQNDQMGRR